MWVLFRAIKVIFVKIIRSPKQVLADGKSNDDLRRFKSTVKFPIIFFFFFFLINHRIFVAKQFTIEC